MRVSIFGLGYVGAVCTASLAHRGHQVMGVDVSPVKIDLITSFRALLSRVWRNCSVKGGRQGVSKG